MCKTANSGWHSLSYKSTKDSEASFNTWYKAAWEELYSCKCASQFMSHFQLHPRTADSYVRAFIFFHWAQMQSSAAWKDTIINKCSRIWPLLAGCIKSPTRTVIYNRHRATTIKKRRTCCRCFAFSVEFTADGSRRAAPPLGELSPCGEEIYVATITTKFNPPLCSAAETSFILNWVVAITAKLNKANPS